MAFDPIWQQQLTLVCYGNEFLSRDFSIQQWKQHSIFNQHLLQFRDLLSQHLLAQHFQVWLEHLKQQGVTRLSLHSSSLLNDEKNPNPNVELLPYAHFIISHSPQKQTAWICGNELAEWYNADNEYEFPAEQQIKLRVETFWSFELSSKLAKQALADLQTPDWEKIEDYLNEELFHTTYAAQLDFPQNQDYIGDVAQLPPEATTLQALLPTQYHAQLANDLLFKLSALQKRLIEKKQIQQSEGTTFSSADEQREMLHFSEKVDDLFAKLIIKVANHYQTAQRKVVATPLDQDSENLVRFKSKTNHAQHHVSTRNVVTLILVTAIICIAAYYFGF